MLPYLVLVAITTGLSLGQPDFCDRLLCAGFGLLCLVGFNGIDNLVVVIVDSFFKKPAFRALRGLGSQCLFLWHGIAIVVQSQLALGAGEDLSMRLLLLLCRKDYLACWIGLFKDFTWLRDLLRFEQPLT